MSERKSRLAIAVLILGIVAVVLPVLGPLGYRGGLWGLGPGLMVVPASLVVAVIGLVLGIVTLIIQRKRGERLVLAAHGTGLSLLAGLYLGSLMSTGNVPIHNISTDVNDPPQFTHAQTLRGDQANPIEYDKNALAAVQQAAYPDVKTLVTSTTRAELHGRARAALEGMGLEVTRDDAAAGELEAVATTFWYAFKDDVVVRLREMDGQTHMDVRSVSRIGQSDLGANAKRILEILERVQTDG